MENLEQNLENLSLNPAPTTPTSTGGVTLELTSEISHLKYSTTHEILSLITLKAPFCESEANRPPLDLVAVIDHSGSMQGEKLKMVQASMNFAITQLKAEDRLGVVLFESEVTTLFPLQNMTPANKQQAIDRVNSVRALNLTALCGGLCEGFDQLIKDQDADLENNQNTDSSRVTSVLLFTDGLANRGLSKTAEVTEEMLKKRELVKRRTSVFCFGFGSDHSVDMLRAISDAGDGMYYYVEDEEKIPSAFGDCIGGLLSVAAQNLKLKMETHNGIKIKKVLGNGTGTKGGNQDVEVNGTVYEREFGDIYSEEERNIVCLLEVPAVDEADDNLVKILSCELTGFDVLKKDTISETSCISILRGQETKMDQAKSLRVDIHRNRLITVQALNSSRVLADAGHYDQGRNVLSQAVQELKSSTSANESLTVALISDLEESIRDMRDRSEYTSKGSKKMAMYSRSHACERAIHSKGAYMNTKKMMEKEKYLRNLTPMSAEAIQQSKILPLSPSRTASVKEFVIGNRARKLEESEKVASSSSPTGLVEYEWTMFIELSQQQQQTSPNEKLSDLVEKVVFYLHPTFNPDTEEVVSEPFELTKKGWGVFQVRCKIFFKTQVNREPYELYHQLVFDQPTSPIIPHQIPF